MKDQRSVLDSSTCVSGLIFENSVPALAVDKALRSGKVLYSRETLAELEEVLRRPKFDRYSAILRRLTLLEKLIEAMDLVSVTSDLHLCRDWKHDKFLNLAVDGNADLLITGDADLLVLHPFGTCSILTAAAYLELK